MMTVRLKVDKRCCFFCEWIGEHEAFMSYSYLCLPAHHHLHDTFSLSLVEQSIDMKCVIERANVCSLIN